MVKYNQTQLDQVFSALSHPIRRGILVRLSRGDASVTELSAPHHISAPAISKHLRILEEAGLKHEETLLRLKEEVPKTFIWQPEKSQPTALDLWRTILQSIVLRQENI